MKRLHYRSQYEAFGCLSLDIYSTSIQVDPLLTMRWNPVKVHMVDTGDVD